MHVPIPLHGLGQALAVKSTIVRTAGVRQDGFGVALGRVALVGSGMGVGRGWDGLFSRAYVRQAGKDR